QRVDRALDEDRDDDGGVKALAPAQHGHSDREQHGDQRRVPQVGGRGQPHLAEQQHGQEVGAVEQRQREQDADLVDEEWREDQDQAGEQVPRIPFQLRAHDFSSSSLMASASSFFMQAVPAPPPRRDIKRLSPLPRGRNAFSVDSARGSPAARSFSTSSLRSSQVCAFLSASMFSSTRSTRFPLPMSSSAAAARRRRARSPPSLATFSSRSAAGGPILSTIRSSAACAWRDSPSAVSTCASKIGSPRNPS